LRGSVSNHQLGACAIGLTEKPGQRDKRMYSIRGESRRDGRERLLDDLIDMRYGCLASEQLPAHHADHEDPYGGTTADRIDSHGRGGC
jgi:hypothetical protein